jgi:hypothetical protein
MAVFTGTLTYTQVGAAIQSFLNQTDEGGANHKTLVLQEQDGVNSIEGEIAAATYTFIRVCKLQPNAQIQLTGDIIALGHIPAILMTNCDPCNQ